MILSGAINVIKNSSLQIETASQSLICPDTITAVPASEECISIKESLAKNAQSTPQQEQDPKTTHQAMGAL